MLNKAQEFLLSILGDEEPKRPQGYKAPHAPIGTPPRPKRSRKVWDKLRKTHGFYFRLFKGHRP